MANERNTFSAKSEESKQRSLPDKILWARFYKYVQPYKKNMLVAAFSILGGALTGLIAPYLHAIAINSIISPAAQTGDASYLSGFSWWIPLFLAITLSNYFFQYVQTYQMRIIGEYTVDKLKNDCVAKLQEISLKYFSEGEIGRIMSRPTTDAQQIRIFIRMGFDCDGYGRCIHSRRFGYHFFPQLEIGTAGCFDPPGRDHFIMGFGRRLAQAISKITYQSGRA